MNEPVFFGTMISAVDKESLTLKTIVVYEDGSIESVAK